MFWLTFFVDDTQDSFTILNVYLYFIFFSIVVSISMLAICYALGLTPHSLAMRAPTVAMELRVGCASTAKSAGQKAILFALIDSCCLTSSLPIFPFFWDGFASDHRHDSVVQIFCSAVLGESRLNLYHGFNYQLQYVQLCFH